MKGSDEQSYEEVIQKLRAYTSKVFEAQSAMYKAGQDCVDNTDEDPAAVRSNGNLQKAIGNISNSVMTINQIIAALNQELEQIRAAAAKANSAE